MAECRKPSSLECPICFENMISRQPRFLRCHPSFCEACLLGIAKNNGKGDIICPTCRYKTPIHKGGVAKLPLDFTVQGVKEELQKSRSRCDVCMCRDVTVDASYRCLDCNQQFCEDCLLLHIDRYASHTSIPIIAKGVNCTQHGQVVRYFCRTCSKFLCPLCAFDPSSEHQRHQVSPLSKEFDSFRIEFYNMRRNIEEMKENIQQYKSNMEQFSLELATKIAAIKDMFEEGKDEITEHVDSVNDEIPELIDSTFKQLNSSIERNKLEIIFEIQRKNLGLGNDIAEMKKRIENTTGTVREMIKSVRDVVTLLDHVKCMSCVHTRSVEDLKKKVEEQRWWIQILGLAFLFCLAGMLSYFNEASKKAMKGQW